MSREVFDFMGKIKFIISIVWRLISLLFFLVVLDGLRGEHEKIVFSFLIIIFAHQMRGLMNLGTSIINIAAGLNDEFISLKKSLNVGVTEFEEEQRRTIKENLQKQQKFYILELIYQGLLYLLAVFTIFNTL